MKQILLFVFAFVASANCNADVWGDPSVWINNFHDEEIGEVCKYAYYDVDKDGINECFVCDTYGNYACLVWDRNKPRNVAYSISSTTLSIIRTKPFVKVSGGCGTGCAMESYCKIVNSRDDVTYTRVSSYGPNDEEEHNYEMQRGSSSQEMTKAQFEKFAPTQEDFIEMSELKWIDADDVPAYSALGVYVCDNTSPTNVRDAPRGKVVGTLQNGNMIGIDRFENGWCHIASNYYDDEGDGGVISKQNCDLWIHSSVITVDWASDGAVQFVLYEEPRQDAKIIIKGGGHAFKILSILDYKNGWAKIKVTHNIVGWVKSELLCGNSLTTCV